LEIRSNSKGTEYLEAVLTKKTRIGDCRAHEASRSGARDPGNRQSIREIQRVADWLGGLSWTIFFYRKRENRFFYAAFALWESNPDKITLNRSLEVSRQVAVSPASLSLADRQVASQPAVRLP